jgi:hypothetical protein
MKRKSIKKGTVDKILQIIFGVMIIIQVIMIVVSMVKASNIYQYIYLVLFFEIAFTVMAIYQFLMYSIKIARKQNEVTTQRKLKEGWYQHFSDEAQEIVQLNEKISELEYELEKYKRGTIS